MCWHLGTYGVPLEEGFHAFPTIEQVAEIEESDLRSHGFGHPAATIPRVAKEILLRGESWLGHLRGLVMLRLTGSRSLPGIGPKLADLHLPLRPRRFDGRSTGYTHLAGIYAALSP